jgi:hypothetical protein
MDLYYYLHGESDCIFISEKDMNIELECIGKVDKRTLSELKNYLSDNSWVLELFSDEELIRSLHLKPE